MKKLWLIIPLLLTVLPVLLIPVSAGNELVSFDVSYTGTTATEWLWIGLGNLGYDSQSTALIGDFIVRGTSEYASALYYDSVNSRAYYKNGSIWRNNFNYVVIRQFNLTDCHDLDLYQLLLDHGWDSYITAHYRFVLDYFPTDVLSYFFYNFFENNYILWCCGIWVLAISFKLFFSRSGVRGCMNG